jgi:soluble lytic murein transglycosylase-like protein
MAYSLTSSRAWVARLAALLLCALPAALPAQQSPDAQRDPELRNILQKAIDTAPCFVDRFDSDVWFNLQEQRLRKLVKDPAERVKILETVFCEATRSDDMRLPPGLVMAVMDVESRFDRWAVSSAGAVGLMQVMPFWPEKLGMKRSELTQIQANIRMGCAILRYYLKRERDDPQKWHKALARYNGSVGTRGYSDLVVTRWTSRWNGLDDLGLPTAKR